MRPGLRWVAVPAVGAAIALWSVATLAGLYSMGTSLTAASNGLPQSLLAPRTIALADPRRSLAKAQAPTWAAANAALSAKLLQHGCDANCLLSASNFVHQGKSARLKRNTVPLVADASRRSSFDDVVAKAGLSPQKLAAAFARAGSPVMLASLPAAARFAEPVRIPDPNGPASVRFGPAVAEIERSSRLALALANTLPEQMIDVLPAAVVASEPAASQGPQEPEVQLASLPPQDDMPDSVPLPTLRPQADIDEPAPQAQASKDRAPKDQASKAQASKAQVAKTEPPQKSRAQASRASKVQTADAPPVETLPGSLSPRNSSQAAVPAVSGKRSKTQGGDMLAYAKPDMPSGGLGGAFRNLFTTPNMGSGVAVYDISAKTVYMPDGSRLEAHSGLGAMVDQPRYVHKKNVGPTPPDTYNLTMRESRFHGVEAIRLTPASGSNKYGRDGLLAHTYMLRGGRAESNGCVVFKDYARFLAAYKKGKIKRLVVVPRLSKPLTRVAQEGRGA
ncbi:MULTISPECIES: tlde1 domain-containing protein [unclassified Mesorhizobium]|uniref:tlde1 domain-containing protein n=1 Tax=unclassified Mesorhizobium TaxID=325217 RepID=UPI00333C1EF1